MALKSPALIISIVISACLGLVGYTQSYAQEYDNTPVTLSKEKVKVGGKVCYSHVVLEKQTLYSISKAYGVSIEDIYSFNPTLQEVGLKKNSIIIIPSNEPVKKEIKKVHTRKWYEDLDMIAANYNVSVESIMAANNLTSKQLTNRQKLIIPVEEVTVQMVEIPAAETVVPSRDESDAIIEKAPEEETLYDAAPQSSKPIHATLLLPFKNSEGKLSRNNMDFYSGAMLAVYDMAQKGINVDINTFDITDSEKPVSKEDIKASDLIIGPISAADQTKLFQTMGQMGPVISPLDPRSERLAAEYNHLIQAPTPHRTQYQDLTNWMQEEMGENDKVFMFTERTARLNNTVETMKEVMDSSGLAYTPFTYSILEGREILDTLKVLMTPEDVNRIYIASESEAFVNDVVRNLNLMLLENYEVVLYAPGRIRNFETIEVEHFHKTSMRVSLNYYINYETQAVKDFLLKYRAVYNTEPSQFAFQGYDITNYFISLYNKYGENWAEHIEDTEAAMLQSTFIFSKLGTGGYVNTGVRRIVYGPKWKVTPVR